MHAYFEYGEMRYFLVCNTITYFHIRDIQQNEYNFNIDKNVVMQNGNGTLRFKQYILIVFEMCVFLVYGL